MFFSSPDNEVSKGRRHCFFLPHIMKSPKEGAIVFLFLDNEVSKGRSHCSFLPLLLPLIEMFDRDVIETPQHHYLHTISKSIYFSIYAFILPFFVNLIPNCSIDKVFECLRGENISESGDITRVSMST